PSRDICGRPATAAPDNSVTAKGTSTPTTSRGTTSRRHTCRKAACFIVRRITVRNSASANAWISGDGNSRKPPGGRNNKYDTYDVPPPPALRPCPRIAAPDAARSRSAPDLRDGTEL